MKISPRHISFARLADLAEGRLTAAERAGLEPHLADCPKCSAQAAQLGRVTHLMRSDASEDAPPAALAEVFRMFRPRAAARAAEGTPPLLRRILAVLTFDSARLAPAYGVRSGTTASRQFLYHAGDLDVDLRVVQGGDGWTLTGQVLGRSGAGGQVEVTSLAGGDEPVAARAEMNEHCEFALPPIPAGDYALRLRLGETVEVEIPELTLRA